jgi:hypothetical protein
MPNPYQDHSRLPFNDPLEHMTRMVRVALFVGASAQFERHLSRCQCQEDSHASQQKVVHGVHLFLSHLRDAGIINLPWVPNHDPALLSAFCQWMHQPRVWKSAGEMP